MMTNDLNESNIENPDRIDWNYTSCCQNLSEGIIEKFADRLNWICISRYQNLSERLIEKFADMVDWVNISRYQKLSEGFIEKFADSVAWGYISVFQKLSERFIEKFADRVDWELIRRYQKLSRKFRKEHKLPIPKNNWLSLTKEEKFRHIKENTDYQMISDEYIIAYKSCRSDGYSKFNFQYRYVVGGVYEAHCDCDISKESSFGLSAWKKENAIKYCDEKLFKVKIMIEDIGAIIHSNGKIRCFKLEVLEEVEK